MPRPSLAEFVAAYEATQPVAPRQEGEAYRMHCVHRQDNNPSLVALQADDGGVVLLDNGASLTLDAYATTLRGVGLLPNGGKAKPKDIPEAQVIPEDRDPANVGVCGAKRTNVFEYRDANGFPVCEVVRFILPNGSKMIRPRRPWDDGYGAVLIFTPFVPALQKVPMQALHIVIAGIALLYIGWAFVRQVWTRPGSITPEQVPEATSASNALATPTAPAPVPVATDRNKA